MFFFSLFGRVGVFILVFVLRVIAFHVIIYLFQCLMVLDDNNSQTGIELACKKPMYIGHDKTERQIKVIYWTVTGISKTTVSEGRVISVLLCDIYVKDVFVSLFSI